MKCLEKALRKFNIINCIQYPSGCSLNKVLKIIVSQTTCKIYPSELKELQYLLNNQKNFEWELTLVC